MYCGELILNFYVIAGNLDAKLGFTLAYMHEQGAEKVAMMGFCW
jgi:dienelactone hydrolase